MQKRYIRDFDSSYLKSLPLHIHPRSDPYKSRARGQLLHPEGDLIVTISRCSKLDL